MQRGFFFRSLGALSYAHYLSVTMFTMLVLLDLLLCLALAAAAVSVMAGSESSPPLTIQDCAPKDGLNKAQVSKPLSLAKYSHGGAHVHAM